MMNAEAAEEAVDRVVTEFEAVVCDDAVGHPVDGDPVDD